MRFSFHARSIQGITLATGLIISQALPLAAFADVLHFQNGRVLRGKLERATGDILEFHSGGTWGSTQDIPRLHLSNRHDAVVTIGHHTYYGEIIYVDKFQVDLSTVSGMMQINRWKVRDIVMGSPMRQPALPDEANNGVQPIAMPGSMGSDAESTGSVMSTDTQAVISIPGSTSNDTAPALRGSTPEGEDGDAIPAVDRTP